MSLIGLLLQLFQLFLFILMMRFALHLARADFYNPLVQGIIKATDWLVAPLQKVIRPGRHIDPATFIAGVAFAAITSALISTMAIGATPLSLQSVTALIGAGVLGAVYTLLRMYMLAIFGRVIMSWIMPQPTHPAPLLILQITRPLMAPLQRFIPPIGGMIDISPLVVIIGITLLQNLVIQLANHIITTHTLIIVGLQ